MSGNPFETSLKTLYEAAELGNINTEVVKFLEQPNSWDSENYPQ